MTVDEQIAYVKAAQAQTDRGMPPYRHPDAVVCEDERRDTIRTLRAVGATQAEIIAWLRRG